MKENKQEDKSKQQYEVGRREARYQEYLGKREMESKLWEKVCTEDEAKWYGNTTVEC